MSTNNFFRSDLPRIHHVVQNAMIVYPKQLVIAVLRDYFEDDTYYHYVKDVWGHPNVVGVTDLPTDAGINDSLTTRLFIGENYRDNAIFYPAILVKHGGSKSVPISINREEGTIAYEIRTFDDGYGNLTFFKNPKSLIFAGAWEGSITIDIMTRSLPSRDELVQEVALCFTDITFKLMQKAGIICKPLDVSAPSETDDRNGKLFRQTITLPIRSEWRREIPVNNVLEVINFSLDFSDLSSENPVVAQNLTINTTINLLDIMAAI